MHISISGLQENHAFPLAPSTHSVDLEQIDPYSLESIKDLLNSRVNEGLDFYVSFFKEMERCYCFEASRFIEQILRKNTRNPLTNIQINYFDILLYSVETKSFHLYCNFAQADEPLFYLPVLINDQTRTDEEKQKCLHKLGCLYLEEGKYDLSKALEYLIQAAERGFQKSQELVSYLMFDNKQTEAGVFWFNKYLTQNSSPSHLDFIFLAEKIKEFKPQESFDLFKKAASKGSYLAVASVIDIYERHIGMQDLSKAHLWRKTLPFDWQECSTNEFLNHLREQNHDFGSLVKLDIPAGLLDDE